MISSYEMLNDTPFLEGRSTNTGKVGSQVDVPADKYLRGGGDQIEMFVVPRERMDYIN